MSEAPFSLKDQLFNADKVACLAGWMGAADPGFPVSAFQARVMARLHEFELKARIDWIATCLQDHLPATFPAAAEVIVRALPPPLDPARVDDDFGDFILAPFGVVTERMGLERHPELSLDLLEALTCRFSMEFSLRAFVNRWPDVVMERLVAWAGHPNYHVRRLVSEGTRPRLPWGKGIDLPAGATLPLLDRLHADRTRYVTRSVANHLNDIARSDPDAAVERLTRWRAAARQDPAEMAWMTRHALRSLIKAGDPRAMEVLGYRADAGVELIAMEVAPQVVAIGEEIEIALTLRAEHDEPVIVDYVVDFAGARGMRRKVFKMKDMRLPAGSAVSLTKRHRFKGGATTFTLMPGPHAVHLQVNGRRLGTRAFVLVAGGGPARTA